MQKHNKYAVMGLKALKRAAEKVAENARKNKNKIPIWRNGRIEYEIPDSITEQRVGSGAKKLGGAESASA